MADWRKVLRTLLLSDGVVDAGEVALLEREIMGDSVVDDDELEFLVDLRNGAKKSSPQFETFFFKALTSNILADKVIDPPEAKKLRAILFADGKIDTQEQEFLQNLKKKAKQTCPEFDKLCKECLR